MVSRLFKFFITFASKDFFRILTTLCICFVKGLAKNVQKPGATKLEHCSSKCRFCGSCGFTYQVFFFISWGLASSSIPGMCTCLGSEVSTLKPFHENQWFFFGRFGAFVVWDSRDTKKVTLPYIRDLKKSKRTTQTTNGNH